MQVIVTRCTQETDVHLGGKSLNLALLKLNCPYNISEMSSTGKRGVYLENTETGNLQTRHTIVVDL